MVIFGNRVASIVTLRLKCDIFSQSKIAEIRLSLECWSLSLCRGWQGKVNFLEEVGLTTRQAHQQRDALMNLREVLRLKVQDKQKAGARLNEFFIKSYIVGCAGELL